MALTLTRSNSTGWTGLGGSQSAYEACVDRVFSDISSMLPSSITTTATIDLQFISLGGVIASSTCQALNGSSYASIKSLLNALTDDVTNNIKGTAYATLPGSDPWGGQYRVRGLHLAILQNTDYTGGFAGIKDNIQLNSDLGASAYDTTVDGTSCAGGKYGLYQIIVHEITELMGRWSTLQDTQVTPLDLFSYTSAGNRSFTATDARYPSWDGGTTSLGAYHHALGADLMDWDGTETGAGYIGTSTASPFGPGHTGDPEFLRYKDVQKLSLILPLSQTGLWYAGLPKNTVAPSISGTATQGQTLTATNGTWVGQSTITKTLQWRRGGVAIGGATNATYDLQAADVGSIITVTETATNIIGAPTQTSSGIGPVAAVSGSAPSFGGLALRMHR